MRTETIERVALTEAHLVRIELLIEDGNAPSRAVAQRAGFTREALMKKKAYPRGEQRDVALFSLLVPSTSQGVHDFERVNGPSTQYRIAAENSSTREGLR